MEAAPEAVEAVPVPKAPEEEFGGQIGRLIKQIDATSRPTPGRASPGVRPQESFDLEDLFGLFAAPVPYTMPGRKRQEVWIHPLSGKDFRQAGQWTRQDLAREEQRGTVPDNAYRQAFLELRGAVYAIILCVRHGEDAKSPLVFKPDQAALVEEMLPYTVIAEIDRKIQEAASPTQEQRQRRGMEAFFTTLQDLPGILRTLPNMATSPDFQKFLEHFDSFVICARPHTWCDESDTARLTAAWTSLKSALSALSASSSAAGSGE